MVLRLWDRDWTGKDTICVEVLRNSQAYGALLRVRRQCCQRFGSVGRRREDVRISCYIRLRWRVQWLFILTAIPRVQAHLTSMADDSLYLSKGDTRKRVIDIVVVRRKTEAGFNQGFEIVVRDGRTGRPLLEEAIRRERLSAYASRHSTLVWHDQIKSMVADRVIAAVENNLGAGQYAITSTSAGLYWD